MYKCVGAMICLAAILTGCSAETSPLLATGAADSSSPNAQIIDTSLNKYAELAARPDPKKVLSEIYSELVNEVAGAKLKDGRYVNYWHSDSFVVEGKHYFVGFAYATDPHAGTDEDYYPAPEEQVTVAHATYELQEGSWKIANAQSNIGRFGSKSRAANADSDARTKPLMIGDGRYLLAIPTRQLETGGVQIESTEVFSFSTKDKKWSYLGNLYTGENDDANCIDGKTPSNSPCTSSVGSLEIVPDTESNFPDIRVNRSGTVIVDQARSRELDNSDVITYRFNSEKSQYQELQFN